MQRFAIGMAGVAMLIGGFVGASNASEDVVVARLVIESAGEMDAGYGGPARGLEIEQFVNQAIGQETIPVPEPKLGNVVPVPSAEQLPEARVASAAMAMPIVPSFESTKSVTSAVAPAIEPAPLKRRVVRTSAAGKRRISIPVPITMGVFR